MLKAVLKTMKDATMAVVAIDLEMEVEVEAEPETEMVSIETV